jgi:hypothetical protein
MRVHLREPTVHLREPSVHLSAKGIHDENGKFPLLDYRGVEARVHRNSGCIDGDRESVNLLLDMFDALLDASDSLFNAFNPLFDAFHPLLDALNALIDTVDLLLDTFAAFWQSFEFMDRHRFASGSVHRRLRSQRTGHAGAVSRRFPCHLAYRQDGIAEIGMSAGWLDCRICHPRRPVVAQSPHRCSPRVGRGARHPSRSASVAAAVGTQADVAAVWVSALGP